MLIAVNYHYIRESFDFKYPSIFGTTPEKFRVQLETLSSFGSFVSENDILDHLQHRKQLPSNALVITFDDGLVEQYQLALPILEEMGIPAIFFVSTRVLEEAHVLGVHKIHLLRSVLAPSELKSKVEQFLKEQNKYIELVQYEEKAIDHYKYDNVEVAKLKYLLNFALSTSERESLIDKAFNEKFSSEKDVHHKLYMNTDQVKELAHKGVLGSHSHEHFPIGTLEPIRQLFQVAKSQDVFERVIGKKVTAFSYPYGSIDACKGLNKHLGDNNFRFAFTMERAVNASLDTPFFLSRFDNNDMPGGKAWKGGNRNPFQVYGSSKWKFH